MKGTNHEVPNPQCSSACDCTWVLTRMDHGLMNSRRLLSGWYGMPFDINSFLTIPVLESVPRLSCLPWYVFGSVLACVQSVQTLQKLSCLPRDRFCSCLCKVCSNVSDALMIAMCSVCSCLCKVCSLLSEAFLLACVSLRSQAPQRQYIVLSFSSMRRHGHSHKPTSSRALRYYTVGIPF